MTWLLMPSLVAKAPWIYGPVVEIFRGVFFSYSVSTRKACFYPMGFGFNGDGILLIIGLHTSCKREEVHL